MIKTLVAKDDLNRVQAEVQVRRGWRRNDAQDRRETVYRIVGGFGYDFGDLTLFLELPIDSSWGTPHRDLRWKEQEA